MKVLNRIESTIRGTSEHENFDFYFRIVHHLSLDFNTTEAGRSFVTFLIFYWDPIY